MWVAAGNVLGGTINVMGIGTATGSADGIAVGWNGSQFTARQGGTTDVVAAGTSPMQTWHHLAYACNSTSSLLYINGTLAATQVGPPGSFALQFHFGFGLQGGAGLKGVLAEPAVYPSKLSAARILAHYQAADAMNTLPVKLAAAGSVGPPFSHTWQNAP